MKVIDLRLRLVEEGHMMLKGRIGNMVYYVRGGRQCRRRMGNMDRKRFFTDPKFVRSQGASREFGAAGKLSTAIRHAIGKAAREIGGSRELHPRLTAAFLRSLKGLEGPRGVRELPAERLIAGLDDFTWSKRGNPGIFPFAHTRLMHEALSLKPRIDFHFLGSGKLPGWATHIRPVCMVVAVSDLRIAKGQKVYSPLHRKLHGQVRRVEGPTLARKDFLHPDIVKESVSWRPDLLFPEAVAAGMGLLVVVGLEGLLYHPDGSLHDSRCFALETAWSGKVQQSIAEARLRAEYEARVAPLIPIFHQRILVPYAAYEAKLYPGIPREEKDAFYAEYVKATGRIWEELVSQNTS